ncbi:substrate-binding domain-containing protein [Protofrankia coriariae]|uniref:Molybdate-binding protein n=2 Tax=Protofrankia TaxID=2994361 RepID=A0ABR5F806_9ACTN|nr:substrate-binding domain-containing protein [Protofrankia coriariae]KLL12753.1 molybdate-binding protein [Protofrankia coriariae]ONH30926.1 molybdate-binding protein [Protofrankia sp. BMG5.30]
MALYMQIADDLARRVRSGELAAGEELPGVREYARTLGTTSSTVVRAYRYLADAGVITMADRRRARVAGEGAIAAARLLEPERVFRLAGSDDPALGVLLDRLGAAVVPVGARGSFQGLRAVARGEADGAVIHLRHRDGVYNEAFARAVLGRDKPRLLHLWRREQGLIVPAGNPRGLASAAQLGGLRVARRELGAGTRLLLEQLLLTDGVAPHEIAGPELHSHMEIAFAVATGIADVGLGVRAGLADLGLDFVPLLWEPYEIALGHGALGAARPLIATLRDPLFQRSVADLDGYDLQHTATVRPLVSANR